MTINDIKIGKLYYLLSCSNKEYEINPIVVTSASLELGKKEQELTINYKDLLGSTTYEQVLIEHLDQTLFKSKKALMDYVMECLAMNVKEGKIKLKSSFDKVDVGDIVFDFEEEAEYTVIKLTKVIKKEHTKELCGHKLDKLIETVVLETEERDDIDEDGVDFCVNVALTLDSAKKCLAKAIDRYDKKAIEYLQNVVKEEFA